MKPSVAMRVLCTRALIALILILNSSQGVAGTRWPQFRGPNASGLAEGDKPPVHFGPNTNLIYKVEIPAGASSPCIWDERLFLTGHGDGKLWTLCYSTESSELLWRREAPFDKLEEYHRSEGSPAASTPATDGERVYSFFGSSGVFAYTLDGNRVWEHRMPTAQHVGDFGTGTSPIVHGGVVLINRDMLNGSHLLALNARTGRELWRVDRTGFISSYSTPIIWEHDGRNDVVLAGMHWLIGYNLETGAEVWRLKGSPNATCPTPVLGEGMLFFAGWSPGQETPMPVFAGLLDKHDANGDGVITREEGDGFIRTLFTLFDLNGNEKIEREEWETRRSERSRAENQLIAVRPGVGDITESNVAWRYTRGLPYVPSTLYYRGLVYIIKDGGLISCFDAKTGIPHYEQERVGTQGSYYPSPVAADGRIYLCSNEGKFTVIAAGKNLEILSRGDLGERCVTTAAIANHRLYVRGSKHLWCFGAQ